jgi:tripartite-type tricarboxylate transporter receptor subunit TctC
MTSADPAFLVRCAAMRASRAVPRALARGGLAAALALAALEPYPQAHAQPYPNRPITIIVSLAPGTGMDTLVRAYGEKLAQRLGQPVIIDNRPGGVGVVAGETIAKGAADGYTLAVATSAIMAIRPTLFKQRPFDPLTDFVPISYYVKSPFVLIVNPSLPVHSVAEFINYAKGRPSQLSYSSSGIGGAPHLTAELLKQKFGFDMTHVPYRNSPQSIADVAAGHVAAAVAEAGASLPLIKDGKLRALAVTSATRFPTLPDVPPIAEAVGMPDLEAVSWHVIFARHDTPRDIVDKLHDEMKRIMAAPEIQQKIVNIGLIPQESPPVEGIQRYIRSETEKWGALVRQLGLEGSQ